MRLMLTREGARTLANEGRRVIPSWSAILWYDGPCFVPLRQRHPRNPSYELVLEPVIPG